MTMHWTYVEWSPKYNVLLPEMIRHAVSADSEDGALRAARRWALENLPYGTDYKVIAIGAVANPKEGTA